MLSWFRLSRARRIVESAFGIMTQTWRVLLNRCHAKQYTINNIILACCVLHNFLRMETLSEGNVDTSDSEDDSTVVPTTAAAAYDVRERVADWCITEGDVQFQYNMI